MFYLCNVDTAHFLRGGNFKTEYYLHEVVTRISGVFLNSDDKDTFNTGTPSIGYLKQEKYLGDLEVDGKIILNGS